MDVINGSNLTNKYNPQEHETLTLGFSAGSNLTNKYNPQEPALSAEPVMTVQILPINTILKNLIAFLVYLKKVQILPINTILKNSLICACRTCKFKSYQ